MKKLFIFLAIAAAGYLVYDNFVKEKEVIHVEGSLARVQQSASLKHLELLQEIMVMQKALQKI